MARRARSARRRSSSSQRGVPPSTLAAQILRNRTDAASQRDGSHNENFDRLLEDFLADPVVETGDAKVEENAKFVTFLLDAASDYRAKNEPFAPGLLNQKAVDCLRAVQLTVERHPDVVLFNGTDCSDRGSKPPLLLWIVAQLLSIGAKESFNALWTELGSTLRSITESMTAKLATSAMSLRLSYLLRSIADGVMSDLRTYAKACQPDQAFSTVFPSMPDMSMFWSPDEQSIMLPPGYQVTLKKPNEASSLLLLLLSSSNQYVVESNLTSKNWFPLNLPWILDSCHELLDVFAVLMKSRSLDRRKIVICLSRIVHDMLKSTDSQLLVQRIARLLARVLQVLKSADGMVVQDLLTGSVAKLQTSKVQKENIARQLRSGILTLMESSENWSKFAVNFQDSLNSYLQSLHRAPFPKASLDSTTSQKRVRESDQAPEGPQKRQKLEHDQHPPDKYSSLRDKALVMLNGPSGELEKINQDHISKLTDADICSVLITLSFLPCAGSGCLANSDERKCSVCDSSWKSTAVENQILSKPDCQTVHYALSQFVNAPAVKGSRKPRILLTQAIRRFLNHTMDKQYLNMSVDPLGVWCAKSFQSSIRELRIVSSQALASYLKDSVPDGCRHRNRCNFLDLLRAIGNRGSLPHRETVALAWGLVGKICGEAELNFALLELVKDLGHPHPMVCGTSFHELRRLATDLGHTPLAMFAPFWRSIAPAVVKDILNCPQRVQQLSDLLGLKGGVDELLALTQSYTVPFLVLTKRHDVLQRLVQASYGTETVEQLITEPRKNLACVLALLLLESGNSEHTASVLLQEAAPNLKGRFVDLVKLDPMSPFCEILKAAGDHDDAKREKAYAAIDLLARLVKRKSRSQEISQPLADFLTEYILGIMAHFTDIVDNLKDQLSLSEKRRALTAIEHLLKLANSSHIDLAFPQVRATLQSAFDAQGLANEAFSAWVALIHGVQDTKVKDLIHHTFSIVIQKWDSFDHDSQIRAHNVLQGMIESHNTEIIENIGMMPHPRGIQMLEKLSTSIKNLRDRADLATLLDAFAVRCRDENVLVVRQALQELVPFLQETQNGVHDIINGQQVIPPVPKLYRSLLDTSLRFQEHDQEIVTLCSQCLGVLGCVDPNKVETVIDKRHILIKSNFDLLDEVVDFIAHMLETVLVEAFRSAPTGKQQSYLAYVMQELLQISGISDAARTGRAGTPKVALERWHSFPGSVRNTLIPYLSSKYCLTNPTVPADLKPFPASGPAPSHATWLRSLVFPLLHRGKGHNAKTIFPVISRVIQNHDLSISSFILPFIVQNIAASGTDYEIQFLKDEMNAILGYNVEGLTESEVENIRQCSEVLDYLSRWLQEKNQQLSAFMSRSRSMHIPANFDELTEKLQISSVEQIITAVSPKVIAKRAAECGSYARSIYHTEQHMRQLGMKDVEEQYKHLQSVYEQINEPDGIEGISAHVRALDLSQQIVDHKRAGRWAAALSWYELGVQENPLDAKMQTELFSCLKASGDYDALINTVNNLMATAGDSIATALPFVTEAAWMTGRWDTLEGLLQHDQAIKSQDFNVGLSRALLAVRQQDADGFQSTVADLRRSLSSTFKPSITSSMSNAHGHLLKLHVLHEVEALSGLSQGAPKLTVLPGRLDVLGSYTDDKLYILGVRRAVMEASRLNVKSEISSSWLVTSRLRRKANQLDPAYGAMIRATELGDPGAVVEHARLLWAGGYHRKAIQTLRGAIADESTFKQTDEPSDSLATGKKSVDTHKMLLARTQLLFAKWMDRGGQEKSDRILEYYKASDARSDRNFYHLASYYNKILDSETNAPNPLQSENYLIGECTKLTIENYLRSAFFGTKYIYRSVPKILTLWLDFGQNVELEQARFNKSRGRTSEAQIKLLEGKARNLLQINSQIKKYLIKRIPLYITYTALAQMLSRIDNPHAEVAGILRQLIVDIASHYPRQALWSVLSVSRSTSDQKSSKGREILKAVKSGKSTSTSPVKHISQLVMDAEAITVSLLDICQRQVGGKGLMRLTQDLRFPRLLNDACPVAVPVQKTLMAAIPVASGTPLKKHKAFPNDSITIAGFSDEVLVLSSLQRPRKLIIRGSDGQTYPILCKPKDDLRKDQRLMEFNAMIDRALKRDVEASKRKLYIKSYAVTTLNDEHGVLEWVDGLKPLRDIIIGQLAKVGIRPNFSEVKAILDRACADKDRAHEIFLKELLPSIPPVLYKWFMESFPEPELWFNARLRYTRSCAVMSIVGNALGLGDRHGENISLEQGAGGVFHVDFNCLFQKGLTFDKPETVPFRLTHNMVDAFGAHGYDGPFRKAAEITQRTLKQYEDTFMTIMEAFIYDPTTDFGFERRKRVANVPDTPAEVLESVKAKVNCLLPGETVPLSVEGYVDALIRAAVDPRNLVQMYVGWCPFL